MALIQSHRLLKRLPPQCDNTTSFVFATCSLLLLADIRSGLRPWQRYARTRRTRMQLAQPSEPKTRRQIVPYGRFETRLNSVHGCWQFEGSLDVRAYCDGYHSPANRFGLSAVYRTVF